MKNRQLFPYLASSVLRLGATSANACYLCGSPSTTHGGGRFSEAASASPGTVAQAAPALSSRPGAAYTVYLNFDGFAFNGTWGNTGRTPGTTAAYTGSTAQLTEVWARTAENTPRLISTSPR